jgi:hypothetical protein
LFHESVTSHQKTKTPITTSAPRTISTIFLTRSIDLVCGCLTGPASHFRLWLGKTSARPPEHKRRNRSASLTTASRLGDTHWRLASYEACVKGNRRSVQKCSLAALCTLWAILDTRARSDRHFEKARRNGGVEPATPRPERDVKRACQSINSWIRVRPAGSR